MRGAGVSTENLESDLAINTIVTGVTDIWNVSGGSSQFSPIFLNFVTQLSMG